MEKGWNKEYLFSKYIGFYMLSKEAWHAPEKEKYLRLSDVYRYLWSKLYWAGIPAEPLNISRKDVFAEISKVDFENVCDQNSKECISKIAEQLICLEKIPDRIENEDTIEKSEANELFYEFLKEQFGRVDASIFKAMFLNKYAYILHTKRDGALFTALGDDEIFVKLEDENNIDYCGSLSHEAGHVKYMAAYGFDETKHSIFGEFESFTYEIRFLLWLIQNNIHKKDAINYLLNTMRLHENWIILLYLNNKYNFTSIKDFESFEQKIQELELSKHLGIKDYNELYSLLDSMMYTDCGMYIMSEFAVINQLANKNYLKVYEETLKNIASGKDSKDIMDNLFKSFEDLTTYKRVRKELISNLKY